MVAGVGVGRDKRAARRSHLLTNRDGNALVISQSGWYRQSSKNPMRTKPWAASTKEEVAMIDATVFWLVWTDDSHLHRFAPPVLVLVI